MNDFHERIGNVDIKINPDLPDIVKLGTGGVTGIHGSTVVSEDFAKAMPYGSYYLRLGAELGFPYSEALIAARRPVAKNGKEDIYKIVFPGSNLTNASHVLTGFAHEEQLPHLIKLADYHGINATFVRNGNGCDELMAGNNIIVTRGEKGWEEKNIIFGDPDDPVYKWQIAEREDKKDQIIATTNVLVAKEQKSGKKLSESVTLTIAYNVAALLYPAFPDKSLEYIAGDVRRFIRKQFKDHEIKIIKAGVPGAHVKSFSYAMTVGAEDDLNKTAASAGSFTNPGMNPNPPV